MAKTYALVRKHFEQLETIRECYEWGWVEESFRDLIENPSKPKAADIYERLIGQWFSEHQHDHRSEILPVWAKAIASQHGISIGGDRHGE